MTKLTRVEQEAHREREAMKFWRRACAERGVSLDVLLCILEAAAERDNRWHAERWYRDNVQTGKAACLSITDGEWP